jgi:hypothetical protein
MMEILRSKLVKRDVDTKSLMEGEISQAGKTANLSVKIQQGIESDVAKKLVKQIKEKKMKVQVSIQGEKLRVTGKKRDDLQNVMGLLRDVNPDLPLQFNNFRD